MTLDKTKVVYQIYPKSFKDTTGNGLGDFRGIIENPSLPERVGSGHDLAQSFLSESTEGQRLRYF